jgi:PAS domain S-box-containing protein
MSGSDDRPLRILHLEDDVRDAELARELLAADGLECEIVRVDTREAFLAALEAGGFDLVLADYALPAFDGIAAQQIALARDPDLPFIFLSGTFGEEVAIERLKAGATDYVLKSRLSRLVPAVRRALREAEERRRRRAAEAELRRLNAELEARVRERTAELEESRQRLQAVLDYSPALIFLKDPDGRYLIVNRQFETLFGVTADEVGGRTDADLFPLVHARQYQEHDRRVLDTGEPLVTEEIYLQHDGFHVYHTSRFPLRERSGRLYALGVIATDITERKAAEEAAKLARLEAEHANRAKSEFLSRMSHDLRTPLNAMLGFAQLLEAEPLSADARDSVVQIRNAGDHLLGLIDEVLDIARIEAGQLSLCPEPVSVGEVVRRAVRLVEPLAARRRIAIHAALPDGREAVLADRQRLSQILLNLLSNAVKYNREEGRVEVACERAGDGRLRILVRDTGPGISPRDRLRLFTPFERLGAERTGIEGTGLGLTVSKELAAAMGGALGFDSEPGRGSLFWVELPLAELPAAPAAPSTDEPSETAEAPASATGTVLYIDDNQSNTRLIERVLRRGPGVRLLAASCGGEGLEIARRERPDLVLLDLHLPDMHGEEVLVALASDAATQAIPVAILSADATRAQQQRLAEAGVVAYLTKPLDIAHVLRLVDRVLGGRQGAAGPGASVGGTS